MTRTRPGGPKAGPAIHATLFWGLAVAVAAGMVLAHSAAGLTLPAPWGDEAFFIWQARAFERWNGFIAPELDPTRPILLLPFVYQALLGLAFKVFGYSFGLARDFSLVCVLTGFVLLAVGVSRRAAPVAAMALIGAFMLNGKFLVLANNARMEALLFALLCAALLLLQSRRPWGALAVLMFSAMVHPNGVLFVIPVAVYAAWAQKAHRTRPAGAEMVLLAAAALAWAANGLYALSYPAGLVQDIAYRLAQTSKAHDGWERVGGWHAMGLGLILATGAVGAWRKTQVGPLVAVAVGCWMVDRLRPEQWYEVFGDFGYLLASLAVLEIAVQAVPALKARFGSAPRMIVAGLVALGLLGLHLKTARVQGPRNYLQEMNVDGMRIADGAPYLNRGDRAAIEAYVLAEEDRGARTVEVYPWGDTLLFPRLERHGVRFQIPYFDPAFAEGGPSWLWGYGPTAWPTADIYLVRASRYQPRFLDKRLARVMARAEQRAGGRKMKIIHSRDGTEVWYAVRAKPL